MAELWPIVKLLVSILAVIFKNICLGRPNNEIQDLLLKSTRFYDDFFNDTVLDDFLSVYKSYGFLHNLIVWIKWWSILKGKVCNLF